MSQNDHQPPATGTEQRGTVELRGTVVELRGTVVELLLDDGTRAELPLEAEVVGLSSGQRVRVLDGRVVGLPGAPVVVHPAQPSGRGQ